MSDAAHKMTFEEFMKLPEEDTRYELIDGRRVTLVPPYMPHSHAQTTLVTKIGVYLGENFAGFFGVELDFPTLPFHGRRPDAIYFAPDRVTEADWQRGYPLHAPDLVIEIVSPDDPKRDYVVKRAEYARVGIPNYWIVDPAAQRVEVLTLGANGEYLVERELGPDDVLTSSLFPGLEIPLAQVLRNR
ncbi:MAG TPA: Uma2 family endonuclease [Armatimonadota bacterium]|nr:Uma2 family endonuclease [Armatimonadota bacterium]